MRFPCSRGVDVGVGFRRGRRPGGTHDGCSGLRDRGIVVQVIDKHRGLLVGGAPRLAMHQVVSCLQQNDTIGGAFGAMPLTPTDGKPKAEQSVVRNRDIPCLDGSYHHCRGTFLNEPRVTRDFHESVS